MAEPTATPSEISIRLRYANMRALACSAALPTMGRRMVVKKGIGTFIDLLAPCVRKHPDLEDVNALIADKFCMPNNTDAGLAKVLIPWLLGCSEQSSKE